MHLPVRTLLLQLLLKVFGTSPRLTHPVALPRLPSNGAHHCCALHVCAAPVFQGTRNARNSGSSPHLVAPALRALSHVLAHPSTGQVINYPVQFRHLLSLVSTSLGIQFGAEALRALHARVHATHSASLYKGLTPSPCTCDRWRRR